MITRDNYEEFFLLYIDHELSVEEMEKVDAFLVENPDLKIEFTLLAETVLKPEALVYFKHKESLYKQPGEPDSINTENYESYFLQYTDNELDEAGKKEVEQFATKHPKLLLELSYFLQTRQEPDHAVIFPDKSLLYRKEETRKWVALPWVRISAAAMVLVLLGLYLFSRYGLLHPGTLPQKELAGTRNSAPKKVSARPEESLPKTVPDIKNSNPVTSAHPHSLNSSYNPDGYAQAGTKPSTTRAGKLEASQKPSPDQQPGQVDGHPSTPTPNPILAQVEPTEILKTGESGSVNPGMVKANAASEIKKMEAGMGSKNDHPGTTVNYALQAQEDNNSPAADQVFYVTNSTAKKSKLRGIFRKVTRVFDKTTHVDAETDKPDILIGGFQIALK